jgi:hypothetical protein
MKINAVSAGASDGKPAPSSYVKNPWCLFNVIGFSRPRNESRSLTLTFAPKVKSGTHDRAEPQKITLSELRASGDAGSLVYCADYR